MAYVAVFCLATGGALDLALGKWFLHDLNPPFHAPHASDWYA